MKKIAFLGYPFIEKRNLSIFSYWIKKYNLDAFIYPFEVKKEDLKYIIKDLPKLGIQNTIVDTAYSKIVFDYLDAWTQEAHLSESVSHLCLNEEKKRGDNLLGKSFIDALYEIKPDFDFKGKRCVILGNGSTAKAIGFYLLKHPVENVHFIYRHKEKAFKNLKDIRGNILIKPWSELDSILPKADLIINATPLGMKGLDDLKIDFNLLNPSCICADVVFNPYQTFFIKEAQNKGHLTLTGLRLLLKKSQNEFKEFFDILPEVTHELCCELEHMKD